MVSFPFVGFPEPNQKVPTWRLDRILFSFLIQKTNCFEQAKRPNCINISCILRAVKAHGNVGLSPKLYISSGAVSLMMRIKFEASDKSP